MRMDEPQQSPQSLTQPGLSHLRRAVSPMVSGVTYMKMSQQERHSQSPFSTIHNGYGAHYAIWEEHRGIT